ncbi:MAG: efflux RND transporter periplasmic adaptor subunit [Armatimonadota bacterium]
MIRLKTRYPLAGLMLFGVAIAMLTAGCGKKTAVETTAQASVGDVSASVTTIASRELPVEEEAPGTVIAIQHAEIAPKVMGRIAAVYVHEGDHVFKGQVLAKLEANDLSANVAQASAGVLNAEAAYSQAKTGYVMQRTQSSVAVQQAQAALEQAKAQLAKAKQGPRPEQVRQADEAEARAKAAYEQAMAYLDMAKEGARGQQKRQADQGVIVAQQQVTQAEAGLASAKASLLTVQADYTRMKNLYDQDIIPKQRLDQMSLQLEMTKQGVRQAEAGVSQAKAGLEIAKEQAGLAHEGARSQEIVAAEKQVAQAKAGYEQAKQEALMAHQGGRWEDTKTAEEAVRQAEQGVRAAQAAQGRDRVSAEDIKRASAGISQAKAGLYGAQTMLGYAVITAPFSGVITGRRGDPGNMAMPQMPIIIMDDDSQYQLSCNVPESIAARLQPRSAAKVTLQTLNATVNATIVQVTPSGNPASRTLLVKANLPRVPGLQAGLFGRLKVVTGTQSRLVIPQGAIVERNGLTGVYIVDEQDKARYTLVTLGKRSTDGVQVLSGVKDGQRVITSHAAEIVEGAGVRMEGAAK